MLLAIMFFLYTSVNALGPNLYQTLECPYNADTETLKRCYRTISQKLHPDKNPAKDAQEKFIKAKYVFFIRLV